MSVDVLVLNTATADFRREDFTFLDQLAGEGGLTRCETRDMPDYSQKQLAEWIEQGFVTPGGLGNTAPLMTMAGLKTAVGANLGKGDYDGLDAQGRYFYDTMVAAGIDMSATVIHPTLPSGTTFIHSSKSGERLGIVYFPNANDDFSFDHFKSHVDRLKPTIVYYMYSGLSKRGDANGGRDLAEFMQYCRNRGALVIADSHTLTGSPQQVIESGLAVEGYRLLEAVLPELDIFFASSDESQLIHNTLLTPKNGVKHTYTGCSSFLNDLSDKYCHEDKRTRLLGVTVSDGAYEKHLLPDGRSSVPVKVSSKFMAGDVIDLVGAGDSFRAGLLTYIVRNVGSFRNGSMDFSEAVQLGNLFASIYIKAPLDHRYCIKPYEVMIEVMRGNVPPESVSGFTTAS